MLGPIDFWIWGDGTAFETSEYRRGRGILKFGVTGIEHQVQVEFSDGEDVRLTLVGVESPSYGDRIGMGKTTD